MLAQSQQPGEGRFSRSRVQARPVGWILAEREGFRAGQSGAVGKSPALPAGLLARDGDGGSVRPPLAAAASPLGLVNVTVTFQGLGTVTSW